MSRVLLDSVVVIDHLNERKEASKYLREVYGHCALSPVTRAEVLVGLEGDAAQRARDFMDQIPCLEISASVGDLAGQLRRRHRWRLPDALQLAVARHHGCALATRNTKDFSATEHPDVVIPYRLAE